MITNKLISLAGLFALPCLGAALVDKREHEGHDRSCVSFPNFLEKVKHATFDDYADTKVDSQEVFQEMKTHILQMYDGICAEKVTTFVLEQEYGDCIAIEDQPTVRTFGIRKIERHPVNLTCADNSETHAHVPGKFEYAESPLKLGLKDRFGNAISCPEHTIPMARLTLEKLTRFRTLDDFFAKSPRELEQLSKRQALPESGGRHLHAIGYQNVANFGGNSWLNLWNPKGYFSLSQQWYLGGEGKDLQTVEGGWQVYPNSHTDKAVLFIYRTAQNYTQGSGCYNLDCPGFVQINHKWFLAGIWDHYSTTNGSQWGFEMQWKLFHGNWWLFLKGRGDYEAVGYYPTSLFNGGQMSKQATQVQYGGEVARDQSGHPWPQMGSGTPALKGYGAAAFQNLIFYIPRDENGGVGVWAKLAKFFEGASCYSIDITNAPSSGSWGTYFFYGGAGGNTCT